MIQDMLTNIYDQLTKNTVIQKNVGNHIKFYDYSESNNDEYPRIIIKPLRPPQKQTGGSNQGLTVNFSIQIDVQGTDRKICKETQAAIQQEMGAFNFAQLSDGLDEYFPETNLFVDARRYEGNTKLYDTNY